MYMYKRNQCKPPILLLETPKFIYGKQIILRDQLRKKHETQTCYIVFGQ